MKVQLEVLEEWIQEQKNQNGKWIFPLRGKRVIWRELQRRLKQIMIALLKKGLRVLAPDLEFEIPACRYIKRKMLKEAVNTEKSHGFKTNELHMFAGTEQ